MHTTDSTHSTRFKVGIFTLIGLMLIGITTVVVNDKPYWWRSCKPVMISVDDATGLKTKSAVRSLGLEIGYLSTVVLSETHVQLGICITEKVEVLPQTRAYIRGEGFLGDKFVELKPIKYVGPMPDMGTIQPAMTGTPVQTPSVVPRRSERSPGSAGSVPGYAISEPVSAASSAAAFAVSWIFDAILPQALAAEDAAKTQQIPVGEGSQDMTKLVNRVDSLVNEMTNLTQNLKTAINPEDLRATMKQLNRTLENASRTLAPEGGLTQTAQRTLAKLEDAIEQLRDQMTRVNQGEGSVGSLLNDPSYADEVRQILKNANRLLSKVGDVRFNVNVGAEKIMGYDSGRAWFTLGIWPSKDRYYLLGVSQDPRGRRSSLTTTTTVGGVTTTTQSSQTESTGILFEAMLGKVFFNNRLDLSLGVLHNDGALSAMVNLGPTGQEEQFQIRGDIYSRTDSPVDGRLTAIIHPWLTTYIRGGIESFRTVNGTFPFSVGAGLSFDDEDIKLLFAFR